MSAAILLSLGALVFYGLNDLVYKRAAQAGVSGQHLLLVQSTAMIFVFFAYGFLVGTLQFEAVGLWGSFTAIFSFVGFFNFVQSMRSTPVSIVAPVVRLNFVLAAALAVVILAESLSLAKVAGMAFAILAVWLLLAGGNSNRPEISKEAIRKIATAVCSIAIANFLFKYSLTRGASTSTILVYQITTLALICAGATWYMNGKISLGRNDYKFGLLAAIVMPIGFICLMEALARGEASVVVPVSQLGFVVAAIVGVLLFREKFTSRKVMGLLSAVAAVGLFSAAAT